MDLPDLYHRIQSDIVMLVKPEDRRAFLSVLTAAFDDEGQAILLNHYQRKLLHCLGCSRVSSVACQSCTEFPMPPEG